jgi:hypothetical protein
MIEKVGSLVVTMGILLVTGVVVTILAVSDKNILSNFEIVPDFYNLKQTSQSTSTQKTTPTRATSPVKNTSNTSVPSAPAKTTKPALPSSVTTRQTPVPTPVLTPQSSPVVSPITSPALAPVTAPATSPAPTSVPVVPAVTLTGIHKYVFDTYGIRIFDNTGPEKYLYGISPGLTDTELQIIKNILDAIPNELLPSNFFSIRVRDLYVNPTRAALSQEELSARRTAFASAPIMNIIKPANKRGVNIFYRGTPPNMEDGLVGDNKTVYTDTFAIVVAHELNHNVDGNLRWCAEGLSDCGLHPSKKAWAAELHARANHVLVSAGNVSENYIRSNVASRQDSSFFLNSPQEFIASLSNAWFQNSMDTFQYCESMLQKGNVQVMSQCLLMMDIYSVGENQTRFYGIDTSGLITTTLYPVTRDSNGRLNGITIDKAYSYTLDAKGIVTK